MAGEILRDDIPMKFHHNPGVFVPKVILTFVLQISRFFSRRKSEFRSIALRQQKLFGLQDITLADDEIEVTKLPQRLLPISHDTECWTLVGDQLKALALEEIENLQKLAAESKVSQSVAAKIVAEQVSDRCRDAFGADLLEVVVKERHDSMAPGRLEEIRPVKLPGEQGIDALGLFAAPIQRATIQKQVVFRAGDDQVDSRKKGTGPIWKASSQSPQGTCLILFANCLRYSSSWFLRWAVSR